MSYSSAVNCIEHIKDFTIVTSCLYSTIKIWPILTSKYPLLRFSDGDQPSRPQRRAWGTLHLEVGGPKNQSVHNILIDGQQVGKTHPV